MKNTCCLFVAFLAVVFLTACDSTVFNPVDNQQEHLQTGGSGPIRLRSALLSQASRDNEFALKLFRIMASGTNDSNMVVSPLSISIALGMAWNGATAETRAEMSSLLEMTNTPDSLVNEYYKVMQQSLPIVDSTTTVQIANSLWYTTRFVVRPSYLQLNKDFFDAEIRSIDFMQPWAKDTINAWVDAKTNHLIPTIVSGTSEQVMFLINAVYFKGSWAKPFHPDQTYTGTFTNQTGGTSNVKMMSMTDTVRYAETNNAQWLDLAYGNSAYSMTLVLPKSGFNTNTVLSSLTTSTWNDAIESLAVRKVGISMPRFKVECDISLAPTLKSLGMKKAFTDLAEFSGISEEPVLISEVKHKTYVEVTEKGTTAAAVTSIGVGTTSMPNYPFFTANKPFLFFIRETGSKTILFAGKMSDVKRY